MGCGLGLHLLEALDLISCNQNVMVIGFKNMSTADASEASSVPWDALGGGGFEQN